MEDTPPIFQEAARCAVCSSAFSTFKRRHHCRCCGKSLCNEHSSNQTTLPQFGIKSAVRVCDDCFQGSKQINGEGVPKVIDEAQATDSLARLSLSSDDSPISANETASAAPVAQLRECTCGMPLCICQLPSVTQASPDIQVVMPVIAKKLPGVSSGASSAGKKVATRPTYGNELPRYLFFSTAKSTNDGGHSLGKKYESTGEGMWEAIKNGDTSAVKDLLATGVDPNHRDRQGMSLLHLAAVFNCTEIAFLLMDAGANVDCKNAQGETPLDCAPATLQYKMQQKLKSTMNNH